MSSFSPERALANTLLSELSRPLLALDAIEYQAMSYVRLGGEYEKDMGALDLGFGYPDERLLQDHFYKLEDFFDDSYEAVVPLLCWEWGIEDDNLLPQPEQASQTVTKFYAEADTADYDITIARWEQPGRFGDQPRNLAVACIEPFANTSLPIIRLAYIDIALLASGKFSASVASANCFRWEDGQVLIPEDVMLIQKLVRSIPYTEFDITT